MLTLRMHELPSGIGIEPLVWDGGIVGRCHSIIHRTILQKKLGFQRRMFTDQCTAELFRGMATLYLNIIYT